MEEFVDDVTYPPEQSRMMNNAYYLADCSVVGHRANYALCCLKALAYARDGKVSSECESALRNKTCVALKMQKEEQAAGKALYYIHREKMRAFYAERERQSAALIAVSAEKKSRAPMPKPEQFLRNPPKIEVPPAKPAHILDQAPSYADAINAALREAPPAPKEPSVSEVKPTPTISAPAAPKGMSLAELARMAMAKQAA